MVHRSILCDLFGIELQRWLPLITTMSRWALPDTSLVLRYAVTGDRHSNVFLQALAVPVRSSRQSCVRHDEPFVTSRCSVLKALPLSHHLITTAWALALYDTLLLLRRVFTHNRHTRWVLHVLSCHRHSLLSEQHHDEPFLTLHCSFKAF